MIITLKGCTATAYIGGLNFFKVSRGTVSGANVTISTSTINKDAATSSSAREIATVVLNTGYENLVVTVTMGGSSVNWYTDGKVTIPANTTVTGDIKISASATAINTSGGEVVDPEQPGTGGDSSGEYESYIGSEYYTISGYRVSYNSTSDKWSESTSGTTSAGTDFLPVSSNDLIWINYVAVVNNSLGSGGFYNADKQFVAPLYWDTFGLNQESLASNKFVTPDNPVVISDIEQKWNCDIKYVKFIAWSSANNSNGLTTTEARIYRNDEIVEDVYTEYIGDDDFSINKYCLPISDGVASETSTGSSSAWATDYIPVNINQKIWLQYIFTMSNAYSCIGIYDSSKSLIYAVKYSDFGLSLGGKFSTPLKSIAISSIVSEGADVAYVRFIAWDTSDGGRSNTAARIYE